MSRSKTIGIILTANKADGTITEVFGDLPTGLIPVGGKPIIFHILEKLSLAGIKDVYIGVDFMKPQIMESVLGFFQDKMTLTFIETSRFLGPGNSLLTIINNVPKAQRVVVNLADTYIPNAQVYRMTDAVAVSKDFIDETKWSLIKTNHNGEILQWFDKAQVDHSENTLALTGVYALENIRIFDDFKVDNDQLQISDLLKYYSEKRALKIYITQEWLDFGHIDKYYSSKKKLISSREFNTLTFDDFLGTITKRSLNKEKFRSEIRWQLDLPDSLKVLAPRILSYDLNDDPYVEMEFYSYPTLSEIWLFSELNKEVWFSVINKLLRLIATFQGYKRPVDKDDYTRIYISKTESRVDELISTNSYFKELLEAKEVIVNGRRLKSWFELKSQVYKEVNSLYSEDENCLIHGDYCFSNILYDLRSGITRLIDARGIWGKTSGGDVKYDLAKLRHSIHGEYDYVTNDLFKVAAEKNHIDYRIFSSSSQKIIVDYFDKKVSERFDLDKIKLIEGILFLSMIPLHSDSLKRQMVFYGKALENFNDVI